MRNYIEGKTIVGRQLFSSSGHCISERRSGVNAKPSGLASLGLAPRFAPEIKGPLRGKQMV